MKIKLSIIILYQILFYSCNTANVPDLEVQEVVDLGYIKEGTSLEKEFTIKNNLDKEVFIKNISTECGCTTISEITSIKGKEVRTVKFEFINNFSLAEGNFERNILIETDRNPYFYAVKLQGYSTK